MEEIVARGFDQLSEQTWRAVTEKGSGSIEDITAMGISYLKFAVAQSAIFRLMFGELKKSNKADGKGQDCLKNVVNEVALYCHNNGHTADAQKIAVRLWTFVHGASSLEQDGDYERVAPGLDVYDLITDVTPRLLGASPPVRAPRSSKG